MATVFTNDQFGQAYPEGIENHWWSLARNQIVLQIVKNLAAGSGRFIEVGCGRRAVTFPIAVTVRANV